MAVSTNPEIIHTINYEEKIGKIRNCLNTWKLHRLTLLGNIVAIKSLANSQLI